MTRILVDTGPLVALLNRRDHYHAWVRGMLQTVEPPMYTCESVVSEACFLLRRAIGGPDAVLRLITGAVLRVDFRLASEAEAVQRLMNKFESVPMSLADACIVRMTELDSASLVLTLDRDFRVYRRNRRQLVPTLMPDGH